MVWIYYKLFLPSHIGEYLGCFQFLAIVDNAAGNIWYKFSCGYNIFIAFG